MDTVSIDTQILSMNYGGWDTHKNQLTGIRRNLADLFSGQGGLATAMTAMAALCEWVEPGSSAAVFPNAGTTAEESPDFLAGLLPV